MFQYWYHVLSCTDSKCDCYGYLCILWLIYNAIATTYYGRICNIILKHKMIEQQSTDFSLKYGYKGKALIVNTISELHFIVNIVYFYVLTDVVALSPSVTNYTQS